jgi:cytochrome c-type biogenesis protein
VSIGGDALFALAAGTLAAVNPCGFAMLPGYLVLFAGAADRPARERGIVVSLGRALGAAATMTAGFAVVFGAFGLVLTPVAATVQRWAPAVTVVVGIGLAVIGVGMLGGRKFGARLPALKVTGLADPGRARPRTVFLYGMSYAITSLGCAVGPFLAVVATTLRAGDLVGGLISYAAYALGMGMLVAVLAVTSVLARRSAVRPLRRLGRFAAPAGGVLLLIMGAYLAWFGAYELRVGAGGNPDDPVVDRAAGLQGAVARAVDTVGPGVIAAALSVIVLLGLAFGRRSGDE